MILKKNEKFKSDIVHVVIETPQYSINKYAYDPELKEFSLEKTLPRGNTFPFDFGFVPNTLCTDGEPIDALVLIEGQTYPGCVLAARLIGVLEAIETGDDKKPIRNDRLIAVSIESQLYKNITDVKDLNKTLIHDIEKFFITYNKHEEKVFRPLKWNNARAALKKMQECKE